MERMTELERFAGLSIILLVVMMFSLCFYLCDTPARMAQQGFIPLRLTGTSEIYWIKAPEDSGSSSKLKDMLNH